MSVVIPNVGEVELLNKMLKDEDLTLKLFKNNFTPDASTVIGDFEESDFTNYNSFALLKSGWSIDIVSGKAKAKYGTDPSWTCGATGNTVYGYWIEGATSVTLLWTERFDSPIVLTLNGVLEFGTPTSIPPVAGVQFVFYSAN